MRPQVRRFVSLAFVLLVCVPSVIAGPTKKPPAKPVNINTASAQQLETVPGIGPATAAKIIQMRKSYGVFKSVDDLRAIRGIGPKRLEKMRKYLTVGKPAAAHPTAPDAKCPGCKKQKAPPADAASPTNPPQPLFDPALTGDVRAATARAAPSRAPNRSPYST